MVDKPSEGQTTLDKDKDSLTLIQRPTTPIQPIKRTVYRRKTSIIL